MSYASQRRSQKRQKRLETMAMIAQLLGGIGQGMQGIANSRDRRAQSDREDKRMAMDQAREDRISAQAKAELGLREEALDLQEKGQQRDDWRQMVGMVSKTIQDRAQRAMDARKEQRYERESKAKIALDQAQADRARRGEASGMRPTTAASTALHALALQAGIDPASPQMGDYLKQQMASLDAEDKKPQSGNFLQDLLGQGDASKREKRRAHIQGAMGAYGMMRQAPAGAPAPEQPMTGMPASVDEKSHMDLLGAASGLYGAMTRGTDLAHPMLAPIWGQLQALGIPIPERVARQVQGQAAPMMGPMPPEGFQR